MRSLNTLIAAQLLLAALLQAGAWTSEKGHGQVILTTSWFETNRGWDSKRRMATFNNHGSFRKLDINPYFEFGVSDRTTVMLNLFAPRLRYSDDYGSVSSSGTGDMELGVRRRLTSASSRTLVSVQGVISVPTYPETRNPLPGNRQIDVEPRLLIGRSYQLEGAGFFWDAETALRFRTDAPADQARLDGTVGAKLGSRLMFLGQSFNIVGLRNGGKLTVNSNPNLQSDFDLSKVQLSTVVRLTRSLSVQTAYFQSVAGRNTGFSRGVVLSLWHRF